MDTRYEMQYFHTLSSHSDFEIWAMIITSWYVRDLSMVIWYIKIWKSLMKYFGKYRGHKVETDANSDGETKVTPDVPPIIGGWNGGRHYQKWFAIDNTIEHLYEGYLWGKQEDKSVLYTEVSTIQRV